MKIDDVARLKVLEQTQTKESQTGDSDPCPHARSSVAISLSRHNTMAHLVRLSVFARPASKTRKPVSLPATWPLADVPSPKNKPLDFANPSKSVLAKALAVPLLETIIDALLSDPDVWNTAPDDSNMQWTARWVAEHLVLWLYGIGTSTQWNIRTADLSSGHQEGRRLRNEFLDLVPYICEPKDTYEPRDVTAPDGSVSLWTALFAWNVFRFQMCDAVETFEAAQPLDSLDEVTEHAESTAVCEAALILASRLREHAALAVLVEAGKMVRAASSSQIPSVQGLLRRTLDKHRPSVPKDLSSASTRLVDVLALTCVIVNNLLSFRLQLERCNQMDQIATLVRAQGLWASSRTPSFTALCCCDNQDFFNAVRRFEAAAVEETHCFGRLLSSNDILVASIEDDLLSQDSDEPMDVKNSQLFKTMRRVWLRVGLLLKCPRFEHTIFKGVQDRDRLRVESLFDTALPAAMTCPAEGFGAFYNVFMSWCSMRPQEKTGTAVCAFVCDPDAHEMFHALLRKSEACNSLLTTSNNLLDLPNQFSLAQMRRNMANEADRRMTMKPKASSLDSSSFTFFEMMHFREADLERLVALARERKWEA